MTPIFQFPYDSFKTQLRFGAVHLARAAAQVATLPRAEIRIAVDYDGAVAYHFPNTLLQVSLLPLVMRAVKSKPVLFDLQVRQQSYLQVPSLLMDLRLKSTNLQVTPRLRTRVYFSQQILHDHFEILPDCHGVFGRSDFPSDVTCSSTMTEFAVGWP